MVSSRSPRYRMRNTAVVLAIVTLASFSNCSLADRGVTLAQAVARSTHVTTSPPKLSRVAVRC